MSHTDLIQGIVEFSNATQDEKFYRQQAWNNAQSYVEADDGTIILEIVGGILETCWISPKAFSELASDPRDRAVEASQLINIYLRLAWAEFLDDYTNQLQK